MNPKHLKLVAEIWSIQRTFLVSCSKHLSKHSKKSAHPPWGSKKESPQNRRSLGLSSSQRCRQLAPVERVHRLCDLHHVLWRTSDVADHHPLDAENEQNITEIIRIMLGLSEYTGEKKHPALYHELSALKYIDSGRFRGMTVHFWIDLIEKWSNILHHDFVLENTSAKFRECKWWIWEEITFAELSP